MLGCPDTRAATTKKRSKSVFIANSKFATPSHFCRWSSLSSSSSSSPFSVVDTLFAPLFLWRVIHSVLSFYFVSTILFVSASMSDRWLLEQQATTILPCKVGELLLRGSCTSGVLVDLTCFRDLWGGSRTLRKAEKLLKKIAEEEEEEKEEQE